MKKPIPPDLFTQLRSHQQWCQTRGEEGKQLEAEGLDLSRMDLFEQNLFEADLQMAKFDNTDLRKADRDSASMERCSFHQALLDEAIGMYQIHLTVLCLCKVNTIRQTYPFLTYAPEGSIENLSLKNHTKQGIKPSPLKTSLTTHW
jgi:uncharacterized protein YjbI with pentapeptide repeats